MVVSERGRTPIAKATDDIGFYNPHTKQVGINKEKAQHWLSVGAQPSKTVHNLFIKEGILTGKKIAVHSQPKKSEEELAKEAEAAKAAEAARSTSSGQAPAAKAAEVAAPAEAEKPAEETPAPAQEAEKPAEASE